MRDHGYRYRDGRLGASFGAGFASDFSFGRRLLGGAGARVPANLPIEVSADLTADSHRSRGVRNGSRLHGRRDEEAAAQGRAVEQDAPLRCLGQQRRFPLLSLLSRRCPSIASQDMRRRVMVKPCTFRP